MGHINYMLDLINAIECQFLIIQNWLPLYQIFLITYLSVPAVFLTYYQYKSKEKRPMFSVTILMIIWLIQIMAWSKGHEIYYQI